jgi:proline racemase
MAQQQVIADGIEQLKEESIKEREKRLREENEQLRELLRTRGH